MIFARPRLKLRCSNQRTLTNFIRGSITVDTAGPQLFWFGFNYFFYIQITAYYLVESNQIQLNWRPAVLQ